MGFDRHAQSEIGMALDALNIIISSYQSISGSTSAGASVASLSNPNAPPTALPPGSLKCEYVPRAVLPVAAQIANEKLALGGKKHHLRSAADILMQGAKKLKRVMADEDQFWAGALRLRKNNWCIVSAKVGAGPGQQQHQQHLFVHYGFRDGKRRHSVAIPMNPEHLFWHLTVQLVFWCTSISWFFIS